MERLSGTAEHRQANIVLINQKPKPLFYQDRIKSAQARSNARATSILLEQQQRQASILAAGLPDSYQPTASKLSQHPAAPWLRTALTAGLFKNHLAYRSGYADTAACPLESRRRAYHMPLPTARYADPRVQDLIPDLLQIPK